MWVIQETMKIYLRLSSLLLEIKDLLRFVISFESKLKKDFIH